MYQPASDPATPARRDRAWLPLPLLALLAAGLPAQAGPARRPPVEEALPPAVALGEAATRAVVARFGEADHWVQKSVVLLSLNHYWHPAGNAIVLAALKDRDRRLRSYALETLLRTDPDLLPSVVSAEIISELVGRQMGLKNDHYRKRILLALGRIAPTAGAKTRAEWSRWWSANRAAWKPAPWREPPPPPAPAGGNRTVVQSVAERAFDLYQHGLDVTICIDTTGSMQPTIDAARDAIGQMLDILGGISPRLRMGLVQYKDLEDMSDGARQIMPLSKNVKQVQEKLGKLVASGGGDAPERVANGLEIALSPAMRWQRNANKLVIIIGDAPPQDQQKALELAKRGLAPKGRRGGPVTGPRKESSERPVITSAISINGGSAREFRAIAEAGGGAFAQINVGGMRGGRRGAGAAPAADGPQAIVEQILVLSFGARFRREMRAFVQIFFAYRKAGFFR